jgi:hypothetical protein
MKTKRIKGENDQIKQFKLRCDNNNNINNIL